jgi:hypothetical protein
MRQQPTTTKTQNPVISAAWGHDFAAVSVGIIQNEAFRYYMI